RERLHLRPPPPARAPGQAKTKVDPAVKTDSRPPVTLIKRVRAVVPAPPRRGPKQTYCRRCNPGARHPIIIPDIITITPVTGSPDITGNRAGRLLIYRQNRRSK